MTALIKTNTLKSRNGALDLYKFLASLMIILYHTQKFARKGEISYVIADPVFVEFFFIISGVLLGKTVMRDIEASTKNGVISETCNSIAGDTLSFFKKKFCGLMPNYYVAWIISFILLHIGVQQDIFKQLADSVWALFFCTETGLYLYSPNAVTWYIAAMLTVMLALYPIMRKLKNIWFFVVGPLLVLFMLGYSYQTWSSLS